MSLVYSEFMNISKDITVSYYFLLTFSRIENISILTRRIRARILV